MQRERGGGDTAGLLCVLRFSLLLKPLLSLKNSNTLGGEGGGSQEVAKKD